MLRRQLPGSLQLDDDFVEADEVRLIALAQQETLVSQR